MPSKVKLKKDKPSADTLYVSSKSDPRLKAYQDSLVLSKLFPRGEGYHKYWNSLVRLNKKAPTPVNTPSGVRAIKKPVQPVVYREEEKIVETREPERVVPVKPEVKAMQYTGDPVYHNTAMGDKGIIGFIKDGALTKISPEDFDRFAVPKETRELILNKEAVDKYMESRLGKYYRR
jgi:hypothetical protein